MPTDRSWRYLDRQKYRELQSRRFSTDAGAYSDQLANPQPSAPKPYLGQQKIEQGGGDNGDGGFFGTLKHAAGAVVDKVGDALDSPVGRAAVNVAETATSGRKLLGDFGVDTSNLPWALRTAIDVGAAPLTLATAGAGTLAEEGLAAGGRAIGATLAKRLAEETASGVAGYGASEIVDKHLPDDTPAFLRPLINLGVGAAAGGAAYKGLTATERALKNPRIQAAMKQAAMAPAMMAVGAVPGDVAGGSSAWRPKVELRNVAHDQPTMRPDLFQARDVPEGQSYDEATVQDYVNRFDPAKVTPGLLAEDTNTGEHVVVSGHHRLETLKRVSAAGQYPGEAQWRVVKADLTDPAQVNALKRLAVTENYTTAAKNLRADLNAYQSLSGTGMDMRDIAGELGRPVNRAAKDGSPSVQDLDYLSTLPKDVIDRLVEEPDMIPLAAEISRASRAFDLNEQNVRSLLKRYGPGGESSGLTRTQLRSNLELAGQHLQMNQAQQSLWGDEPPILKTIDAMQSKERELNLYKQRLANVNKVIAEFADDPETAALHSQMKGLIDGRIASTEKELASLRADYESGGRVRADVPDAGQPPPPQDQPTAPLPGQTDLFGDTAAEPVAAPAPAGPETTVERVPSQPEPPPAPEQPDAFAGAPNPIPPLDRSSPHAALGLDPQSTYSEAEIKAAYRAQRRRYHPDVNPSETATSDMQALNAALQTLLKGDRAAGRGAAWSNTTRQKDYEDFVRQTDEDIRTEQQKYRDATRERAGVEPPPPGTADAGRYRHFGENDRFSLFDKFVPQTNPRVEARRQATLRGQIENLARKGAAAVGGEALDPNLTLDTQIRPIVVGLKNSTDNAINHFVALAREQAQSKLRRAGITIGVAEDGNYHINSDVNMPPIEDVIERSTSRGKAFYDNATPEQRDAFDFIEKMNEVANKTIEAHGGTLPVDESITGTYFPRKVKSLAGVDRTSGTSSYRRSRTADSLEEGTGRNVADGGAITYGDPMDAFEAGLRGKLRAAQDSLMVDRLKKYAVNPRTPGVRAGFGYEHVPLRGYAKHPSAADLLFPQDVANRIKGALETKPDTVFSKVPKAINSVLTPLRATGDLSATMQQGMAAWLRNPVQAGKMWTATVASLHDPDVYFKALDKLDADGPGILEQVRWGGHITNATTDGEMLLPKVAQKLSGGKYQEIPGLGTIARKSNEHFSRFLNLIRMDMGNDAWQAAVAKGLKGPELDAHMLDAWKSINRATGWTGRRPTSLEQVAAFAPRYLSATVEQISAALTKGGIEGTLARQHLGRLLVVGAGLTWAINTARGYDTEFNPAKPNFLRIRNLAGLDITPLGSYDTIVRAAFGTAFGNNGAPDVTALGRFAEQKLSPALKTAEEIGKGKTYLGEPINVTTPGGVLNTLKEEAKSSLPFTIQNLFEEGPASGLIGTTGLSARLETPAQKLSAERDHTANSLFGKAYGDLSGAQKSQVNESKSVTGAQGEADAQAQRRGGDSATQAQLRKLASDRMAANARYLAAGKDDAGNAFTGSDYRDSYRALQQYVAGARSTLGKFSGGDSDLNGWFDLYDKATMANGQLDFNALDSLQADYRAKHPGIDEKADAVIGIHDDATLREYRQAQKLAQTYYDMPAYLGLTADESQRASNLLAMAQQIMAAGGAPDTQHALAMLADQDPEGATLARFALRRGSNPERKQFRQDNPLFTKFYG